uniref:Uncharacterized protein U5 n=1 Tax=Hyposoter didymator TaxID=260305 RepID=D7P5M4_HYPDD|nr:unknown [Hyposoter didymator]
MLLIAAVTATVSYALTSVIGSLNIRKRCDGLREQMRSVDVKFYRRNNGKSVFIVWEQHQCAMWHNQKLFIYDHWHGNEVFKENMLSADTFNLRSSELVLVYDFHEHTKNLQKNFPNEYMMRELFEVNGNCEEVLLNFRASPDDKFPALVKQLYTVSDELNIIAVVYDALDKKILTC